MIEIISGTDCGSSATTPGHGSCHFGSVCLDSNGDPSPNGVNTDDECGCDAATSMVTDPNNPGHCILGGLTGRFDHSTKFSPYFGHHLKNIQFSMIHHLKDLIRIFWNQAKYGGLNHNKSEQVFINYNAHM